MKIKLKEDSWKIILLFCLFIVVWLLFCCINFPYRCLTLTENGIDKEIIGIIFAAVAAFAGLLIPLHYSLSLDIIGKIHSLNPEHEKVEKLRRYLHTSDIVVYTTAIFGVSSLLEGGFLIGSCLKIFSYNRIISFCLGTFYLIMVGLSIIISFLRGGEEWNLKMRGKTFRHYFLFLFFIGLLSILWARDLLSFSNTKITAFLALIILSLFYFLWILLRISFTPMSSLMDALKNAKQE